MLLDVSLYQIDVGEMFLQWFLITQTALLLPLGQEVEVGPE